MSTPLALALLILRLALGLSFIGHGTQKLFGWFGGAGFAATAANYGDRMEMRPGWFFAALGGGGESLGGLLMVLGFLTPLGALLILGSMLVAIWKVTGARGYWIGKGGWEYNALIIVVCITFILAGSGAYSLDAALGLTRVLSGILPAGL